VSDRTKELSELADLRDRGVLSESEFAAEKERVLALPPAYPSTREGSPNAAPPRLLPPMRFNRFNPEIVLALLLIVSMFLTWVEVSVGFLGPYEEKTGWQLIVWGAPWVAIVPVSAVAAILAAVGRPDFGRRGWMLGLAPWFVLACFLATSLDEPLWVFRISRVGMWLALAAGTLLSAVALMRLKRAARDTSPELET